MWIYGTSKSDLRPHELFVTPPQTGITLAPSTGTFVIPMSPTLMSNKQAKGFVIPCLKDWVSSDGYVSKNEDQQYNATVNVGNSVLTDVRIGQMFVEILTWIFMRTATKATGTFYPLWVIYHPSMGSIGPHVSHLSCSKEMEHTHTHTHAHTLRQGIKNPISVLISFDAHCWKK